MSLDLASLFQPAPCFTRTAKTGRVIIKAFTSDEFDDWLKDQDRHIASQVYGSGFDAQAGRILALHNTDGAIDTLLLGLSTPVTPYDFAVLPPFIRSNFSSAALQETVFFIDTTQEEIRTHGYLGWALGCYRFTVYKAASTLTPELHIPSHEDITRTKTMMCGITLLRNLVNLPANALGPLELEAVAVQLANTHKAKLKVVKGASLEKGFPLVHAVGKAATPDRAPRLIEIEWGPKDAPRIAIVGKGVCFDSGGLDLKPSQYMKIMKKDMGGAAHALALAQLIMALNLPIRIHVIIPAVENSVSGAAFRPGDVFTARNGLTVENTDTDAEGRLILADSLTYASEFEPDMILDFATLTGSARVALGMDIPPFFTNDTVLEDHLRAMSYAVHDPMWPMPLHTDYRSILKSDIADTTNHASVPGDLIYSAIFLEQFVGLKDKQQPKWVHIDCYAWEANGRPGRTKGGRDTSLRAVYALLEDLYGKGQN